MERFGGTSCVIVALILVVGLVACAKSRPRPLVPLALGTEVNQQAVVLTQQGMLAYEAGQFGDAKGLFRRALDAAPDSGHAHYNLAVALTALGENDQAHQQFIEAANLAPGDKVIWDSPALRPYGNPEAAEKPAAIPPGPTGRGGIGGIGTYPR